MTRSHRAVNTQWLGYNSQSIDAQQGIAVSPGYFWWEDKWAPPGNFQSTIFYVPIP